MRARNLATSPRAQMIHYLSKCSAYCDWYRGTSATINIGVVCMHVRSPEGPHAQALGKDLKTDSKSKSCGTICFKSWKELYGTSCLSSSN